MKGKVAEVSEAENGCVNVVAENAVTGKKIRQTADLVVLWLQAWSPASHRISPRQISTSTTADSSSTT